MMPTQQETLTLTRRGRQPGPHSQLAGAPWASRKASQSGIIADAEATLCPRCPPAQVHHPVASPPVPKTSPRRCMPLSCIARRSEATTCQYASTRYSVDCTLSTVDCTLSSSSLLTSHISLTSCCASSFTVARPACTASLSSCTWMACSSRTSRTCVLISRAGVLYSIRIWANIAVIISSTLFFIRERDPAPLLATFRHLVSREVAPACILHSQGTRHTCPFYPHPYDTTLVRLSLASCFLQQKIITSREVVSVGSD